MLEKHGKNRCQKVESLENIFGKIYIFEAFPSSQRMETQLPFLLHVSLRLCSNCYPFLGLEKNYFESTIVDVFFPHIMCLVCLVYETTFLANSQKRPVRFA